MTAAIRQSGIDQMVLEPAELATDPELRERLRGIETT
jgi:hypothetical protein